MSQNWDYINGMPIADLETLYGELIDRITFKTSTVGDIITGYPAQDDTELSAFPARWPGFSTWHGMPAMTLYPYQ